MKDWINILDDFLRISRKDILTHAGKISAKLAKEKADKEYDKFKERTKNELSPVEIHFLETIYVLLDAEIEQALSAAKVRTQVTFFFCLAGTLREGQGPHRGSERWRGIRTLHFSIIPLTGLWVCGYIHRLLWAVRKNCYICETK